MHDVAQPNFDDLVMTLGDACDCTLRLVRGSVVENGEYLAVTATSEKSPTPVAVITINVVAKIFVAPGSLCTAETWALMFFYVDGIRVAPTGAHHLRMRMERGPTGVPEWRRVGWEDNEFDEWSDLERLDS